MNVQVLISCMHEKDFSIIERSKIQTDAVVVNQCDEDSVEDFCITNNKGKDCRIKFINTTQRGLSRSRNMAIKNSWGDILLFCDDDEVLDENYEDTIISAYIKYQGYDIITFKFRGLNLNGKIYPDKSTELNMFKCSRVSSCEVTMKKNVKDKGVLFNEKMGSGSGNGAGEENKFLVDSIKRGIKIFFVPIELGVVSQNESQWFKGYTEKFHRDRGWSSRQIYGPLIGAAYIIYSMLFRIKSWDKENNIFKISYWTIKGYFEKR